jgi:tRNA threonylcarbamoyladenosine biosynthesis protein TsaB
MSRLLHIDTSLHTAHCAISHNGVVMADVYNGEQQQHAAWLHEAVRQLMEKTDTTGQLLDAVSVACGPGSYTGLRVGMATAKGFCYAWQKPLVTVSNLQLIAAAVVANAQNGHFIRPMIDARRMEVFTGLFDNMLNKLSSFAAIVLNEKSFQEEINEKPGVIFCGDGAFKMKQVTNNKNLIISEKNYTAHHHAVLAYRYFTMNQLSDVAYCEPEYAKAFQTNIKKQ